MYIHNISEYYFIFLKENIIFIDAAFMWSKIQLNSNIGIITI